MTRPRSRSLTLGLAMLCAPLSMPAFVCCAGAKATAPSLTYPDAKGLSQRLDALERAHRKIVRRHRLSDTATGEPVWLVELGRGNDDERRQRPGLLVVAGIEGDDPFGTSVTLAWLDTLVAQQDQASIQALLEQVTIYVVPRVNMVAAESMFGAPQLARTSSLRASDDDRDGLLDEDPPEDLDGDGKITWMRVEDPQGDHILDPIDSRLMLLADASKGERGQWRYLPEGIDNDADEAWNEDPVGGVNFNRNYPHDYAWFQPDAGTHQVSEPETRALADFVIAHPNIAVAFTFGRGENLASACSNGGRGGKGPPGAGQRDKQDAPRHGGRRGGRGGRRWSDEPTQPKTEMDPSDTPYLVGLGERYRDALGLAWGLADHQEKGTFADWIYYQRGRMALSTSAWSPELAFALDEVGKPARPDCKTKRKGDGKDKDEDKAKSTGERPADTASPNVPPHAAAPPTGDTANHSTAPHGGPGDGEGKRKDKGRRDRQGHGGSDDDESRNRQARAELAWIDEHLPSAFVAWKPYNHPDFPDRRVEIGGFVPYADRLPPPEDVERLTTKQASFLTELALALPRIAVRGIEVKDLGEGVYDVKIQVENAGYLPTATAQGETTQEVHATRVVLDLAPDKILAGRQSTTIPTLAGSGGMHEVHYTLFLGSKRKVDVEVVSMIAGTAHAVIDTKEAK